MSSSEADDDDDNSQDNYLSLEIMKNNKPLTLDDLPKMGGKPALAYKDVMMLAKLYMPKQNIENFIESQIVNKWNCTDREVDCLFKRFGCQD
jgi:hypothetical protein